MQLLSSYLFRGVLCLLLMSASPSYFRGFIYKTGVRKKIGVQLRAIPRALYHATGITYP
jgi:hypothetical protein